MTKIESRYATLEEVSNEIKQILVTPFLHCATCIFFENSDEMVVEFHDISTPPIPSFLMIGLCRRHAPKPVLDLDGDGRAAWPIVDYKQDWCGDHQLRERPWEQLAHRYSSKVNADE